MEDIDKYRSVQKKYLYPLHAGYMCFGKHDHDWHPCLLIKGEWFAISHTKNHASNFAQLWGKGAFTGKYYQSGGHKIDRLHQYLIKCDKPTKIRNEQSGWIYIKPHIDFIKQYISIKSISELELNVTSPKIRTIS